MKKTIIYIATLLTGLSTVTVRAQSENDKIIFSAMEDELQRNKTELALPGASTPFFISYAYATSQNIKISGSLGAITDLYEQPRAAIGTVEILLGDYHRTSDFAYTGQAYVVDMPLEANYDVIRRNLWLVSDNAYKNAIQYFAWKKANQKANPLSPEEENLDDLSKVESVEKIIQEVPYEFDRQQWEKNIRELSAIFIEYKELFNTTVSIEGLEMDVYKKTSEGVTLKQPVDYVSLQAKATTLTKEGSRIGDSYSVIVRTPQELPSMEKLKSDIRKFADNLSQLRTAERITEYYSGPILFEDEGCMRVLSDNLLNQAGLFAFRRPENGQRLRTLEDRIGRKIIDNRITVKNYSTLSKYANTPLLGAYEIDAEGVAPAKEITLVENGILKQLLNGRVPTLKAPASTGSSRFLMTNQNIQHRTAPGTIHFQVKKGLKDEKMKKALLKAAKEEGLDYAYIIRRVAGATSLVYKVNVKDGVETLMRTGDFGVDLSKLKRFLAISASEKVSNYILNQSTMASIIYPSSILIEDIEIRASEVKKEKEPALKFPLQREEK